MKNGLKPILLAFIIIMIAIPFIIDNANTLNTQTSSQYQNDTINISNARTTNNNINESKVFTVSKTPLLTSNLSLENLKIYNASGVQAEDTTDYVVNLTDGTYTLVNSTYWVDSASNITYVTYNYYASNYNQDAPTRGILTMIIFFMALGLVVWVIWYFDIANIQRKLGF